LALSVDELLTIARPRAAKRAPTQLGRLVTDTVAFLERQLKHAHVTVSVENDQELPGDLPLDANKIRQLLVNLLLNAMQAIVRDGTITVRTRWDATRRVATLEVSDDGPGIPESVRGHVFELFVSTKDGGGGLGLAVAKKVVEEHDGTIDFETSGQGTTFRVELPAGADTSD
jgi:signal transduction histidine kinase